MQLILYDPKGEFFQPLSSLLCNHLILVTDETTLTKELKDTHPDLLFFPVLEDLLPLFKKLLKKYKTLHRNVILIEKDKSFLRHFLCYAPLDLVHIPFDAEKLRFLESNIDSKDHLIELKLGRHSVEVDISDILYLEKEGRRVKVTTFRECHQFYSTMKDLEKKLQSRFIRIHQSFLVNGRAIQAWNKEQVKILGTALPVSRSGHKALEQFFHG
ncbi:LytR/AlgR family response regulator transcription factor [Guggenheimella bovis]